MKTDNSKLWEKLKLMPPTSHWPDRSKPFDYANSQVVSFIIRSYETNSPRHAVSLFNQATKNGCINFDRETKLWQGRDFQE